MTLTLYGLKNCDTCRKAMKYIKENNIELVFFDIRNAADLETLIPLWLTHFSTGSLINRRSTTWRQLDESTRALSAGTVKDIQNLLRTHPSLIKRPIISDDTAVTLGWGEEQQAVWTRKHT